MNNEWISSIDSQFILFPYSFSPFIPTLNQYNFSCFRWLNRIFYWVDWQLSFLSSVSDLYSFLSRNSKQEMVRLIFPLLVNKMAWGIFVALMMSVGQLIPCLISSFAYSTPTVFPLALLSGVFYALGKNRMSECHPFSSQQIHVQSS